MKRLALGLSMKFRFGLTQRPLYLTQNLENTEGGCVCITCENKHLEMGVEQKFWERERREGVGFRLSILRLRIAPPGRKAQLA